MPLDKVLEDVLSGVQGGVSGKVLYCEVFGEERLRSLLSETSDLTDALLNSTAYVLELSGSFNFKQSISSPKSLLKCRAFCALDFSSFNFLFWA